MILPAIDLINGQCVRLTQGDYEAKTTYYPDPVDAARMIERAGLPWLHLVDLDGAKTSEPQNLEVLRRIKAATNLRVEYGGGIKTTEAVEAVLAAGADRIIAGSIAVRNPELFRQWLHQYGADRIVLGADCRDGMVATHGWLEQTTITVEEIIGWFTADGLRHVIVTDIARDGMLTGPNVELYQSLRQSFPTLDIIASGGVGCNDDIHRCEAIGIEQVIVGKAIYEGRVTLC